VTLGKRGTLHARRLAAARLHTHGPTVRLEKEEQKKWRTNEDVLRILFDEIAPAFKERNGGYTRIVKMEQRPGDSAQKAILEWVDEVAVAPAPAETAEEGEKKDETKSEGKTAEAKA
jgi:large subunit ribosomal protein L17